MRVEIFSELRLIAEISATLLGFVAIFLVLSNRDGRFSEADRHFVQALVLAAATALVAGLFPFAVRHFVPVGTLWTISLGLLFVIGCCSVVYQIGKQFRMSAEEAAKIHWGWHVIAWGMVTVASVFIVAGLFGFAAAGMYVAASTTILVLALWSFLALVFRNFF